MSFPSDSFILSFNTRLFPLSDFVRSIFTVLLSRSSADVE